MQEEQKKDEMNSGLLGMFTTCEVEEQCTKISSWLKQHYQIDGIGFFFRKNGTPRAYYFAESVPMNIVQGLEEALSGVDQAEETGEEVSFFGQKEEKIAFFSPQEDHESLEPMGLTISLTTQDRSIATLALIENAAKIQGLTTEKPELLSFIPLISSLIDNAVSHEQKDKKIRMLNLYQSVSSALAYIGDLMELLTTIVSIVTSELHCEESSVLFYDEDKNEFEFFTAVGETGMNLVKERFPADKGIAGRALRERTTLIVNDVQSHPDFYGSIDTQHDFKTKSMIAAPLVSGDESVGVINAINKVEDKYFDKEDDQILSAIADEVALAVKNARLFDFVVDSYCKIRQGLNSCKGCKLPLKSWTPCVKHLNNL